MPKCLNILAVILCSLFMIIGIILDVFMSSIISSVIEKGDSMFCPPMTESYRDHLKAGNLMTFFFGLSYTEEEKALKVYSECQHLWTKMATNKYPSYFISQWMIWALVLHIWVSKAAADSTKKDERALIRLVVMLGMCLYRYWTYWSSWVSFKGFYTFCNNHFPISDPAAQPYNYKCISWLKTEKVTTTTYDADLSSEGLDDGTDLLGHAILDLHSKYMYSFLFSYMGYLLTSEARPVCKQIYNMYKTYTT